MTEKLFLNHPAGVDGEAMPFQNGESNLSLLYSAPASSSIVLRDYQESSILQLEKQHQAGIKRLILCLPTGAGKTVTFAEITRRTLTNTQTGRVLILTDRIELLQQAAATLERAGLTPGVLCAHTRRMPDQRAIVAMAETYFRRKVKGWTIDNLALIIMDEAHKGNFRNVIELHPDMPLIGATATPLAASKQAPLHTYFEEIVVGTHIHTLIQAGHLARPRYFAVPMHIKAGKGPDGDYKTSDLFSDFDKPALYQGCVSNHQKHAQGKKTLIFCVNRLHTKRTSEAFLRVHDQVRYITSEATAEERKATLHWFANTPGAILVNCGILTTGFDEPSIECIVLNRATRSLPLYLQMCGRGSRTTASKSEFIILDMGNNIKELGFWHEPYDWECIFHNGSSATETRLSHAPVKSCPHCDSILALAAQSCPYCQHSFFRATAQAAPLQEVVTEEIEVDWTYLLRKEWHTMSVTELIMRAQMGNPQVQKKTYKLQWIVNCILKRDNPRPMLEELARLRGYQPAWIEYTLRQMGNSRKEKAQKARMKKGKTTATTPKGGNQ